ncbi:MAG TPA: M20/M25/M40 family metallo-hydrolase [Phenylobacterium sp.]
MGRYLALLIALLLGSWIAFHDQMLPESRPAGAPTTAFSAERAFAYVNVMAAAPHPMGSPENGRVRDALVSRMARLGLSPQVRPGVAIETPKWASDRVFGGSVENIVGVLPGRDRGAPALALMAHYDSVPGSPGAADDAIGVATTLETVRALKARGPPARDVMVVITDGEEGGLLGANHFFRRDPLSKHVGLVINAEARGSSGRVNMFQTSPENGGLIDLFARTARHPASSSLSVLIYEKMPNDTDLTETLRAGIAGMNYAIIGRQFDYHSPSATPANLDRGSLQDMGTQVLAAAGKVAFDTGLPERAPNVVYSNVLGDVVVGYPAWFGWLIVVAVAVLMALAVRWSRHAGEFPATDILRGMGGLAYAGVGAVAVLEFARRLTGAGFGFVEQRVLMAQSVRWEWAIVLLSLGFLMLAAGGMARGRRWIAAVPLALGLGASAFGDLDWIGIVAGVVAGALGALVYNRPASRKGAWAGALALGLLLTVVLQAAAPGAAYVVAWPLLAAAIGAAATAFSAKPGPLPMGLLSIFATATLAWQGGITHFAYEGMDLMPLFVVPVVTAGLVLWPLAQPETGARTGLVIGGLLLAAGLALTLVVRIADPWTPRYPQASYVGYQLDQDAGRAWRFSPQSMSGAWTDAVLRTEGGSAKPLSHWAWRRPMLAAPAPYVVEPAPAMALAKAPAGTLQLSATPPAGARTLELRLRASSGGQVTAVGGVPVELRLLKGEWVRIYWQSPGTPLAVDMRPGGTGRLDVRYVAGFDRWPTGAAPLPKRPADLMPWDNSDSTFVSGTRSFTW